ncbi:MAG: hypothetical protein MUO63_12980 [Desulfobulbaceae bacterium]|nr:hypothetical protein [Desulfobulbaceae bacterium]
MSFLPARDLQYLESREIEYEENEENGQKGIVLKARTLPDGRFDVPKADVLILLPSGYPDVAPDMFYLLPWVKLANGGRYPRSADQPFQFKGQSWQRWSRHNKEWRPGADGIWTMLKRVEFALQEAA